MSDRLATQRLTALWKAQDAHDRKLKAIQTDVTNWTETYLLGLIGEVDEVLRELRWKRHHRKAGAPVRENVADELADITKYVLALWQVQGFTLDEMLSAVEHKTRVVVLRIETEFSPPAGRRVIVCDLDGTIVDFRTGFARWRGQQDTVHSLNVDLDNDIPFGQYERLKDEFESTGGYGSLPPYEDGVRLLFNEQQGGAFLFLITARPASKLHRIEQDTLQWLARFGLRPDSILFGRDERILELISLASDNEVVLLEDDATLALRAAQQGFPVMLRDQPYNRSLADHRNITRHTTYPESVQWEKINGTDRR